MKLKNHLKRTKNKKTKNNKKITKRKILIKFSNYDGKYSAKDNGMVPLHYIRNRRLDQLKFIIIFYNFL